MQQAFRHMVCNNTRTHADMATAADRQITSVILPLPLLGSVEMRFLLLSAADRLLCECVSGLDVGGRMNVCVGCPGGYIA